MLSATAALDAAGIAYCGPGAVALSRCYDKWSAYQAATAAGIDCPATYIGDSMAGMRGPLVLKPRQGSDSLGLRLVKAGDVPSRFRDGRMIGQPLILGTELTVGVLGTTAGAPLRLHLPEGTPYTFLRKYLLRPERSAVTDPELARRVVSVALETAAALGVAWAARVDFMLERATGRLLLLECDAAPLVGPGSAFEMSLSAGGVPRAVQFARLLGEA